MASALRPILGHNHPPLCIAPVRPLAAPVDNFCASLGSGRGCVRTWLEREPTKAGAENAKSSDQRRGVPRTLNTATEGLCAVPQALK